MESSASLKMALKGWCFQLILKHETCVRFYDKVIHRISALKVNSQLCWVEVISLWRATIWFLFPVMWNTGTKAVTEALCWLRLFPEAVNGVPGFLQSVRVTHWLANTSRPAVKIPHWIYCVINHDSQWATWRVSIKRAKTFKSKPLWWSWHESSQRLIDQVDGFQPRFLSAEANSLPVRLWGKTHARCRPFKELSDLFSIQQNWGKPGQTVTPRHLVLSWSYFKAAEQMLNKAVQPLSLRNLVRETAFLAFCGEAVCSFSFFFACLTMTFTTWAALQLNGMYLLCSCTQYPVELRLPAARSHSPTWSSERRGLQDKLAALLWVHSFSCG